MLAEIAKLHPWAKQGSGRLRDEHLSAVPRSADARSAMNVKADIAFVGADRLAGVDAHPHAYRASGERALGVVRRRDSSTRLSKRHQECVALRIDLNSLVRTDRTAQYAPVFREHFGIALAELMEKLGRALDVGKEERNRPLRKLSHPRKYRRVAKSEAEREPVFDFEDSRNANAAAATNLGRPEQVGVLPLPRV
jgi:hypothetical protein